MKMTFLKAMKRDMTCRGMKYRLGEVFCAQGPREVLCSDGVLHFVCGNILDLDRWSTYDVDTSDVFEVEPLSNVLRQEHSPVCGARTIRIVRRLGIFKELLQEALKPVGWLGLRYGSEFTEDGDATDQYVLTHRDKDTVRGIFFPSDGYARLLWRANLDCERVMTLDGRLEGLLVPVFGEEAYGMCDYGFVLDDAGHLTEGSATEGRVNHELRYSIYATKEEAMRSLSPKDGSEGAQAAMSEDAGNEGAQAASRGDYSRVSVWVRSDERLLIVSPDAVKVWRDGDWRTV